MQTQGKVLFVSDTGKRMRFVHLAAIAAAGGVALVLSLLPTHRQPATLTPGTSALPAERAERSDPSTEKGTRNGALGERANAPRFLATPAAAPVRKNDEIHPGAPFDPAEIVPVERRARMMRQVRDEKVNEFIRDAELNTEQAQKLAAMLDDVNTKIDAAFNEILVPAVGTSDPARRDSARLGVMKVLGEVSTGFESAIAGFGPQAVDLAKTKSFNVLSLLTPEQSEQLRSFAKRFGSSKAE